MGSPIDIAVSMLIAAAALGVISVTGAVSWGLIRRWARPNTLPPGEGEGVEELRQAVAQISTEVAELQERLDFAERVLAAQREPGRIEPGVER